LNEYVDFLRNLIGKDWIISEFNKIEEKSQLKEVGSGFSSYHPFVKYLYELRYILRTADAYGQTQVLMRENHYRLFLAGYLIKLNIDKVPNEEELISRLRDAERFYDVIWEFMAATIFLKNNIPYSFKNPVRGNSNDLTCIIDGRPLEIECKNKHEYEKKYAQNMSFINLLSNRLSKLEVFRNCIFVISFIEGFQEDIKQIVKCMESNVNKESFSVLGKYNIERIKVKSAVDMLLESPDVRSVVVVKEVPKKDLYSYNDSSSITKMQLIFKYPEENSPLRIDNLLRDANKQLPNGGVLFLKVPKWSFDDAIFNVSKNLSIKFSNITAVKVIAIEDKFTEEVGVKVSAMEKLIVNRNAKLELKKKEYNFLDRKIALSIFK